MISLRVGVVVGILGMIGMIAFWIHNNFNAGEPLQPLAPGHEIFYGKGRCGLCHTIGVERGGKCPNLDGAGDRLTPEFIYEALTKPEAYVRLDFDLPLPKRYPAHMPPINKPPIGLTEDEMDQVIGFVKSHKGGGMPTSEDHRTDHRGVSR